MVSETQAMKLINFFNIMCLAGHIIRGNEPATKLLFWEPETPRRRGQPNKDLEGPH